MAGSKKFVALFRTTWTSAKNEASPAALKRFDFSKGLGPLLDQIEKKWDAAADANPVPAKLKTELTALVTKFQATAKTYQQQIIEANQDDPANGPAWMALHEALRKIDSGLVQDVNEVGLNCKALKIWASKKEFDRLAGKTQPPATPQAVKAVEEAGVEYREQGFNSLLNKLKGASKGDALAFSYALDVGVGTCLQRAIKLVKKLGEFTQPLHDTVKTYQRHMAPPKPDLKEAAAAVERAAQIVKALLAELPPEGKVIGPPVIAMLKGMNNALKAKVG
jgi:hypothetical protein